MVDAGKRNVYRPSLLEFLEHGLHYVFPQQPGTMVTGIATAHSYVSFRKKIVADIDYVWEDPNGDMRGLSVKPLYKGAILAVQKDRDLYMLLAAIDMIRVGKTREKLLAKDTLRKYIKNE